MRRSIPFRRVAISLPEAPDWRAWGTEARLRGAEALMIRGAADAADAAQRLADLGLALIYNGAFPPPTGFFAVHHKSSAPWELWPGVANGRSCHTPDEAAAAANAGYDYVFFGPVFETRSHPGEKPAGLAALQRVCAASSIPVFALGGVNAENEARCRAAGAYGVAGIDAFLRDLNVRK